MSKESEALKNIVKEVSAYKLHGLGDRNWMGVQDILQDVDVLEQAFNELERLKKVEKLLELYKELATVIRKIKNQLKELEKVIIKEFEDGE